MGKSEVELEFPSEMDGLDARVRAEIARRALTEARSRLKRSLRWSVLWTLITASMATWCIWTATGESGGWLAFWVVLSIVNCATTLVHAWTWMFTQGHIEAVDRELDKVEARGYWN